MIKSNKTLWFGSILTVAFLIATFFVPVALATADPVPTLYDGTAEVTTSAEDQIEAETISIEEEAKSLGVEVPGRFHFLKSWGYSIQKAVTFDPVKKAEIDLKQASERIVQARQFAMDSDDPEVQAKVDKALDKYQEKMAKIKERSEEFKAKSPELAEKFLDKFSDRQIKQQDMISKLEEKMPEEAWQHLNQVREKTMEHYSDVIDRVIEDKDKIADHLLKAFDGQNVNDFNRLKHIEILKNLEDKVPAEAKASIIRAQENVLDKFKAEADRLPSDLKELNYMDYLEKARKIQGKSMDTLEELSDGNFMPYNVSENFKALRDEHMLSAEAMKKGIENLSEEEMAILERAKKRTMERFEVQKEEYGQLRERIENNYEMLPPAQRDMLDSYKENYEDREEARSEHQEELKTNLEEANEAMKKEQERLREHAKNLLEDLDEDIEDDEDEVENDNDSSTYATNCPQYAQATPQMRDACRASGGEVKQIKQENGCYSAPKCIK